MRTPNSEAAVFALVVRIERVFTADLANRNSQEFKSLSNEFIVFLTPFYQRLPGFIRVVVISFSLGSVVADCDVIFNKLESTATVEQIKAPILQASENMTAPFTILNVTAVQSSISPSTSSPVTHSCTTPSVPTAHVRIANSEAVVFLLVLRIDRVFTPDLANRKSQEFNSLSNESIVFFTCLYQHFPGFIRVDVISFSSGSVVADLEVIFNKTKSTATVEQIKALILQARETKTAPFTILDVTVSERDINDDDDGLEIWINFLIVCLGVAFIVLVVVSLLVSFFQYMNIYETFEAHIYEIL